MPQALSTVRGSLAALPARQRLLAGLPARAPRHSPASAPALRSRRAVAHAAQVTQAVASDEKQQEEQQSPHFNVELPSVEGREGAFTVVSIVQGRGAAIVINTVEPGSEAMAAGVRPGQQLLAVSDPIRPNEIWQLHPQSSLRHTRQAIRMRVPETINLRLSTQPIPEWAAVVAARRAAAAGAVQQAQAEQQAVAAGAAGAAAAARSVDDAAASGASIDQPAAEDLLSAIIQEVEAQRSGTFDAAQPAASASAASSSAAAAAAAEASGGDSGSESGSEGLTVAEKLEREYAQRQAEADATAPLMQRQLTDLEKRQRRRKAYFAQQSERNDGPFFAAVLAIFVVPPAVILGVAFASGYLESLDVYGLLR